ncbi:MAG: hypothetical protein JSS65_01720 [Armatimonadetes bacterium]|nr:hypothetical protein [Armatimonadota bacterium]
MFFAWVVGLALVRLLVAVVVVPREVAGVLTLVTSLVFVGGPIVALYIGGGKQWSGKSAGLVFGLGAVLHVVGFALARPAHGEGVVGVLGAMTMQAGVLIWCLGLGGLVSLALKEKALLLPVALFLAGFDVFLVATPFAPTARIVENNPEILRSMAASVPKVNTVQQGEQPQGARIVDLGLVGPADLAFMGMFFACLHKFQMQARKTAVWLAPVMALYFLLAISPFGIGMLPAMVPIGATVLAVNWRGFGLQGQERAATAMVAVISVALAAYGIYQRINYKPKAQPVEPSQSAPAPESGAPAG